MTLIEPKLRREEAAENARLDRQATAILDQFEELVLSGGPGWVFVGGIEAGRGMGKTSLLLTVRRLANTRSDSWARSDSGEAVRWAVLPRVADTEPGASARLLFEPSRNRAGSLIANLIEHIEPSKPLDPHQAPLDPQDWVSRIFVELARQERPDKFIDIASDESPSVEKLPNHLGDETRRQAMSDLHLARALSRRMDQLAQVRPRAQSAPNGSNGQAANAESSDPRPPAVLLLVDDFDLAPREIIIEFFGMVHRYLEVEPGSASVVILTAFDRSTLAREFLVTDGQAPSSATWAKLSKHIPYVWPLRGFNVDERFEMLWPAEGPQDTYPGLALPLFWPEDSAVAQLLRQRIDEAREVALSGASNRQDGRRRHENEELDFDGRALARFLLGPSLIPHQPRLIKRLHNRLVGLYRQARLEAEPLAGSIDSVTPLQDYVRALFDGDSQLPVEAYLPFACMLIAADVIEPEAGHWGRLVTAPEQFFSRLREWSRQREDEDSRRIRDGQRRERRRADVVADPSLALSEDGDPDIARELGGIARAMDGLSRAHREIWRPSGVRSAVRELLVEVWGAWTSGLELETVDTNHRSLVVALSINADASEAFADNYQRLPEGRRRHLDLRESIDNRNSPMPAEIPTVLNMLAKAAHEQRLADSYVPMTVVARAPLPAMCWLGWYLNRVRSIEALNAFGQTHTVFRGPSEPPSPDPYADLIPPDGPVQLDIADTPLELVEQAEPSALLLIELFGTPTPIHRVRVLGSDGVPVAPVVRAHLHRLPGQEQFRPDELEETLRIIADQIAVLRRRYEVERTYLALRMPDVVAFFLGHNLRPGFGDYILCKFERSSTPPTYHAVGRLADPPTLTAET